MTDFYQDVPEIQQEDVLTAIAEAAQGYCEHDHITILDRDRRDAINVRAEGIIELNGVEHTFIVEDGNWNGTTIEDWDGGKAFEHHQPTKWALAPAHGVVSRAVMAGTQKALLVAWDAFLERGDLKELPREYAYDRMMQPGSVIESHYRDKAAKYDFRLCSQEDADEVRERLSAPGSASS